MAQAQTAAITTALNSILKLNQEAVLLVPGGFIYGQAKPNSKRPYGTIKVTEGETERDSGPIICQEYLVDCTVYGDYSVTHAAAVQEALNNLLTRYTKLGGLWANGWVLHIVTTPMPVEEDPERKEGKNVLLAKVRWEMVIQESLAS